MWPFLDPIECRVAEQLVADGQHLEAARTLLSGKSRDHKAVRAMLAKLLEPLVGQARRAFEAGQIGMASELIDCAAHCGQLSLEARELAERIAEQVREQQRQTDWNQRRLAEAKRWAEDGRFCSAIAMISPLDEDRDAARLRLDWQHHQVVAKPIVTLGTPRESAVDMPIQARLRPQHALIVRETKPGPNGETHRLIPSAGALVRVNDATINDGSSVWLTHGDRLQIGPEISRWTYRRPVKDSKTAVLEQTRPDGAVATLSGGITVRRVVLLDDELRIGRDRGQNHLLEAGFPVSRLRLVFRSGHWRAVAERGALFINDGDDSDDAARTMNLPAELVLFNDDQNILAGALQGERQDYTRTLRLTIV